MANLIDAGGSGAAYARGVVAQAQAAILPEVRRLIDESIGRIAVRAGGNLTAIGIRSALMFDPAATAVVDDPDHEQVIVPLGGGGAFSGAHVFSIVTQNLVTGGPNVLHFEEEVFDTDNYHDKVTNNDRLTIPVDGTYAIWGLGRCSNESHTVPASMSVDIAWGSGALVVASQDGPLDYSPVAANSMGHCSVYVERPMKAGEYVRLRVWHNTGHTEHTTPDQYGSEGGSGPPGGGDNWPFDAIQFGIHRLDSTGAGAGGAGSGAGDWTELATYTVPAGVGQHEIDFSGLDQSYKELVAAGDDLHTVDSSGGGGANVGLRFNTDDGSDYRNSFHRFGRVSAVAVHDAGISTNAYAALSNIPGDVGTDADIGDRGHFLLWLPGYSTTGDPYKFCRGNGGFSYFSDIEERDFHTRWLGGVAGPKQLGPITQLTFIANVGSTVNFAPGSRITIYGVGPI
jgi:hypothetical protein